MIVFDEHQAEIAFLQQNKFDDRSQMLGFSFVEAVMHLQSEIIALTPCRYTLRAAQIVLACREKNRSSRGVVFSTEGHYEAAVIRLLYAPRRLAANDIHAARRRMFEQSLVEDFSR